MKFSDLLLFDAKERGIEHFFGIPGSGFPMDAMESGKKVDVNFIHVAHESTAAIAAAYYGDEKKSPGLALTVKGVGAGNLAGGVANTYFERKPLLCVCEAGPEKQKIDLVQVMDHFKLFDSISSFQANINPSKAREQLKSAILSSIDGRPSASVINITSDYQDNDCGEIPDYKKNNLKNTFIDKLTISKVSNRISLSKRPLILLGADVERDKATQELILFVEKIGGSVLVNMDARGIIPENHPRWAGVFTGNYNLETIEGEIEERSDLIILIGADSMMTHIPWSFNKPTIEIVAREEYNSTSKNPEIRINGNLKTILKILNDQVKQSNGFSLNEINEIKTKVLRHFVRDEQAIFTVQDIIESIKNIKNEDTTIITETGAFIRFFEHLLPVNKYGSYLGSSGGRTMGLTIPASIGYGLAKPDTPKIGIGADGSTLMRLGELEVFSRNNIVMPIVIINDMALGTMKARQNSRGFDSHGLNFVPVDFSKIAEAVGLYGVKVNTPESFYDALKKSMTADKTTIIDARVDQESYWSGFAPSIGDI